MVELKLVCAVSATILGIGCTIPYILDTIRGKTQPHLYTWLIWSVTQAIAAAGVYYGNGGWTAIGMTFGAGIIACVALLSIPYGTKNITAFDTVLCAGAFLCLFAWFLMEDPLLAVLLATGTDLIGYIPTLRKTWDEPASETMSMWFAYILATLLALAGLQEYNMLTMSYLLMCVPMNTLVFLACLKRFAKQPNR